MTADNQNVYELLAQKLAKIPPGLPRTADGRLEINLLRWIFTREQAEVVLAVLPIPEPAEAIAKRLDRPAAGVKEILQILAEAGCIVPLTIGGQGYYRIVPMIPGLQEPQFRRQDKTTEEKRQFARMWEEYYPTFAKIGSYGPAPMRTVPVGVAVEASARSHRLEDAHRMVDDAKTIHVVPCVCREERRLHGSACNHSSDVCLFLTTTDVIDMAKWMPAARRITTEEAHLVIDKSEEEGLVHETANWDDPNAYFLCNCCSCCCVILRAANEFGAPLMMASNFVASVDQDGCTACAACTDDRCPMEAIAENDGVYSVESGRCIGCGVCVATCPADAIVLARKPDSAPPLSARAWAAQRETNRPTRL